MAEVLDQLRVWIEEVIRTLGYPGISLVMLLENLFPPIPSEIVMPFAGFLVSRNSLSFWGALLAGTAGAFAGGLLIYWAGRVTGEERVCAWIKKYGKYLLIQEKDFEKTRAAFNRHGGKYILFGRLIPGVRSLISLPAGMGKMNIGHFTLYTLIGTAAWNALLLLAGLYLGRQWQHVLEWIKTYETVLWIAGGLLVLFFVARRLSQGKKTGPE